MSKVLKFPSPNSTLPTIERIRRWNHVRNGLKFDIDLEARMLTEEANEFFTAASLVDQIDAYCDFVFVSVGTLLKYESQKNSLAAVLLSGWELIKPLSNWIETIKAEMEGLLLERLQCYLKSPTYESNESEDNRLKILAGCLDIVIRANERKGTELVGGKVAKPSDFVSPEQEIYDYLCTVLKSPTFKTIEKRPQ